jgi:dTDP-4-amino-4,6-dideoxygalactose transaminase
VHRQPAYEALAREGKLGVSERLCEEVVSLPLYPELSVESAKAVVQAVRTTLSERVAEAAG